MLKMWNDCKMIAFSSGFPKHCSQQQRDQPPVVPAQDNGSLCYEEHNGVIEIGLDAKIVPTYSFEEIRNQIEEKWKEEIKTKMAEVIFFC